MGAESGPEGRQSYGRGRSEAKPTAGQAEMIEGRRPGSATGGPAGLDNVGAAFRGLRPRL